MEGALVEADALRGDDLVSLGVLEEAVLVDSGAVREGVLSDNRLVLRYGHVADLAYELAGAINLPGVDAGLGVEEVAPRLHDHHNLLEGAVSCALAEAVHGALDLPCAVLDGDDGVRGCHAEVIVAVDREDALVDIGNSLDDAPDLGAELVREVVADGVRDVDGGRACGDGLLDDDAEVVNRGASCILAGELDVVGVVLRELYRMDCHLADLVEGLVELGLEVDVRCRDEGVDAEVLGRLEGLGAGDDVLVDGARESAHAAVLHGLRDGVHRAEVARGGNGEAHLHDIDAELLEGERDLELLFRIETGAERLLAVAERGIEYYYAVRHFSISSVHPLSFCVLQLRARAPQK